MAVHVAIPAVFLSYTNGLKEVPADGATLAEVLTDLDTRHPGLRSRVVTDEGSLRRFVNIYVNDAGVPHTSALDTAVGDGDSVMILPAVAGG